MKRRSFFKTTLMAALAAPAVVPAVAQAVASAPVAAKKELLFDVIFREIPHVIWTNVPASMVRIGDLLGVRAGDLWVDFGWLRRPICSAAHPPAVTDRRRFASVISVCQTKDPELGFDFITITTKFSHLDCVTQFGVPPEPLLMSSTATEIGHLPRCIC